MGRLGRFFDFQGRAGRLEYWRFQIVAGLAIGAVLLLTWAVVMAGGPGLLPFLLVVPLLTANAAVIVRRLHDRDHSGWLALPLAVLPFLLGLAGERAPFLALIGLALSLWGFIELGWLRGTRGPNMFGSTTPAPRLFAEQRS